jgi:hypothetical protein
LQKGKLMNPIWALPLGFLLSPTSVSHHARQTLGVRLSRI